MEQSPKWLDRTDDGTVLDVFEHKRETDRAVDRILVAPRKLSSGLLNHFSRTVKVNHWNDHQKAITGTDAITGEAVSIRAATASDYAETYMDRNRFPNQEDRLRRAEERFTKMDRFGAIQEGEVVVLSNVRGVAYDGPPAVGFGGIKDQRSIPMFEKSEMLSDEVAIEVNRRLEADKPQEAPTPKPDLNLAPESSPYDNFKPS